MITRIILTLCFVLITSGVYAGVNIPVDGLSESQKNELIEAAAKMKKIDAAQEPDLGQPKKYEQYVDLGKSVALALTVVAKELGIAMDQFLQSSTGKLVVILIVWKVMGWQMVHIAFGLLWIMIWIPIWLYIYRKMCIVKCITIKKPIEGWKSIKEIQYWSQDEVGDTRGAMFLAFILCIAITLLAIFSA